MIAEVGRAVGADKSAERVGGDWRPEGAREVRASLHHNDQIAAACDVESKLIRLHAEAACLRLRIP